MNNTDIVSFAAGAGNLNLLSGDQIVAAEFAVEAINFIAAAVKEQQELNAVYRSKRNFFIQHAIKLSDYSTQRNKTAYPDITIDSTNWKKYFNPVDFERRHGARRKTDIRHYKTELHSEGLLLSWKTTEVAQPQGTLIDSIVWRPMFTSDLRFDFSRDFEFRMMVGGDKPIGAIISIKIADNYLFDFTPVLTAGYSDVTKYGPYRYNAVTNLLTLGMSTAIPKKFHPSNKLKKELVIQKKGNLLRASWETEKSKFSEVEINTFFNKDSFKVTFLGDNYYKGDEMIIYNVSLKYL